MGTEITEFKPIEASLAEFRKRYDGIVYDFTDPDKEKQARSDRYQIGRVVGDLDRIHKVLKAPLLEQVRDLDGERKRIKDELQTVQGGIAKQITEYEDKLREHEEMLQAKVTEIKNLIHFEGYVKPSPDVIRQRIAALGDIAVDETFEDRQEEAERLYVETDVLLSGMLEEAIQNEAERAELERLRREAEEREEQEAEEKRKQEEEQRIARQAEDRARQAEREAKKKVADAERRAKEAAARERERIENERRDEELRAKKKADAEAVRKARDSHRKKIQDGVKASLKKHGFGRVDALVAAIDNGLIKNVTINY
jgi:hypothetical protein